MAAERRERGDGSADGAGLRDIAADVRQTVGDTATNATKQARDAVEDGKTKSVSQAAGISRAVHDAADQLGSELPQAAGFIHSAADKLESASSALRERNVEDLVSEFSNFARRQPAAAFAGALVAGFAFSRFIKSSTPSGGGTSSRSVR